MAIADVVANFDALMVSIKEKIDSEYGAQRIVGSDYATVYLGSMQSALQTALGYETQGKTAEAEIALLTQKKYSEEAQIRNRVGIGFLEDPEGLAGNTDGVLVYDTGSLTLDPGEATVTTPVGGGVMGKQQVLYNKQTDGFDRDAEQKLAKVMNDLFAIHMSTTDGVAPPTENQEPGINEVLVIAKEGIGIP